MFTIGQSVKVLPPFLEFFPATYVVIDAIHSGDGSVAYILDQDAGGFDAVYLELA